MPYELFTQYLNLPLFLLVAARLAGLIMFQPILGSLAVPTAGRAMLVLALTIMVMPLTDPLVALPVSVFGMVLGMLQEVLVGAVLGLVLAGLMLGMQLGGQLIAQETGLAFGQIVDPNSGDQSNTLSNFYIQFAGLLYLLLDGHRAVVLACLDSFESIPLLTGMSITQHGVDLLLGVLQAGAELAVKVAAPTMITLFLVNVAMGFVSRTIPQLNILTFGFSVKTLIGFLIMVLSLPMAAFAFADALEQSVRALQEMLAP